MISICTTYYVGCAIALIYLLLLTPPLSFLWNGWDIRRRDIEDSFSDEAIKSYYRAFHPLEPVKPEGYRNQFSGYYQSQFGRSRFFWPILLFGAISGWGLFCSAFSIIDLLQGGVVGVGKLPIIPMLALAGAILWVLWDEITRCHSAHLSPADVYWWCFRLSIAIPMGYAVKSVFAEGIAYAVVFFLGAFPTSQLMAILRRLAAQKLGFSDSLSGNISELQALQGIDVNRAEEFESENITTILQLAYCDPIRLTIRTGLGFSYMTDCICQALFVIYVVDKEDQAKFRKCGLRSAYEVLVFWLDLHEPATAATAQQALTELSTSLGWPEASLRNVLMQVAMDPYTQFLYLAWSGESQQKLTGNQREVLGL